MGRVNRVVLPLLLPALLIVLWLVLSRNSTSAFYPPLTGILGQFGQFWQHNVTSDVLPSLRRMYEGYAIGSVVAIVLGVGLALSQWAYRFLYPLIEFVRALPGTLVALVFFAIFGTDDSGKVILIAVACSFPVLLNVIDGVRGLDPTLRDVASSYRLTLGQRLWSVILPYASPRIAAGLRTGLSIAFIVMIASEFLGGTDGIGYFTFAAAEVLKMEPMWAGVISLGLLGFLSNLLFSIVEGRILRWYHRSRGRIGPVTDYQGG